MVFWLWKVFVSYNICSLFNWLSLGHMVMHTAKDAGGFSLAVQPNKRRRLDEKMRCVME